MIEKCGCENHEHFVVDEYEAHKMGVVQHGIIAHAYGAVAAATGAPFVGLVCDGCAETHLRDFAREFQPEFTEWYPASGVQPADDGQPT